MLAKRKALTKDEAQKACRKIVAALLSREEIKNAGTVMMYLPIKNEVDVTELIRIFGEEKRTVVPVSDTDTCTIIPAYISADEIFRTGAYGIKEPLKINEAKPEDIDVIIVPGAVFNKKRFRIGYGKGYYDRFLGRCKAKTIGVAYDFQITDDEFAEAHDIPVDTIITEKRVI